MNTININNANLCYQVIVPSANSDETRTILASCQKRVDALSYCYHRWTTASGIDMCTDDGRAELITFDGTHWSVVVPTGKYTTENVEGFHLKEDAIAYAQDSYEADEQGFIQLVSTVIILS